MLSFYLSAGCVCVDVVGLTFGSAWIDRAQKEATDGTIIYAKWL